MYDLIKIVEGEKSIKGICTIQLLVHTSDSNHQEMFINNYEADLTDAYGTLPPSSCHDKLYGCHGNCLNNSGDLILCHIII